MASVNDNKTDSEDENRSETITIITAK